MTNTPICLFASTHLIGFVKNIDWVLLNLNYKERYYFIRSPIMTEMNQIPGYHLITGSYKFSELGDLGNLVQNALSGTFKELKDHVQTLDSYLENYCNNYSVINYALYLKNNKSVEILQQFINNSSLKINSFVL